MMLEQNVFAFQSCYRYVLSDGRITTRSPTNFAYAPHVGYIVHKKHWVPSANHVPPIDISDVAFFPHQDVLDSCLC